MLRQNLPVLNGGCQLAHLLMAVLLLWYLGVLGGLVVLWLGVVFATRWLQVQFLSVAANTGWVTIFRRANHLSFSSSHPGQVSLLPLAGQEMSTSRSAVMLWQWLGSKRRMAHSMCG